MSNCIKKIIFHTKLLKTGFVANDNWRQAPGFELLHHIWNYFSASGHSYCKGEVDLVARILVVKNFAMN